MERKEEYLDKIDELLLGYEDLIAMVTDELSGAGLTKKGIAEFLNDNRVSEFYTSLKSDRRLAAKASLDVLSTDFSYGYTEKEEAILEHLKENVNRNLAQVVAGKIGREL